MRKLLIALPILVGACSSNPPAQMAGGAPGASNVQAGPSVDRSRCDEKGKKVQTLDTNGDGKADIWKYYAAGPDGSELLTCKQTDLNHDGRVDVYAILDNSGNRVLEQFDLDFDGRIDSTAYYEAGKRVRSEIDTNFDNQVDVWKHYENGRLVRLERDSNRDGRVDYWEYYEAGRLDRIGLDTTGSGRVDRWERAAEDADAAETVSPPEPARESAEAAKEPARTGPPGLAPGQTLPKKEPPAKDKKK